MKNEDKTDQYILYNFRAEYTIKMIDMAVAFL